MYHSTDNVIAIETTAHRAISARYSSKPRQLDGLTIRQWLSAQSFEAQWAYDIKTLRDFGVIP